MKSDTLTSNWKWYAIAAAIVFVIPIGIWTQHLFRTETTEPPTQLLPVEESEPSEQTTALLTHESSTQGIQPGISMVEDNIFTGKIASVSEPLMGVVYQNQFPSYRLSIPGYRENVLRQFQGANTEIPGQPE